MPQRKIDVSSTFNSYEGEVIKYTDKDEAITLRKVILAYARNASLMGLKDADLDELHVIAAKVGQAEGELVLSSSQYDTLKRVTDTKGKVKMPNGTEDFVNLPTEIRFGAKDLVDAAETVED